MIVNSMGAQCRGNYKNDDENWMMYDLLEMGK